MVAFSNADGGTLIIGVRDDGTISTSSGIYLTKSGADKRRVSPEELRRLFAESSALSADESPHSKSTIKDLDQGAFHQFFSRKKNRDFSETGLKLETVIENLNLYSDGHLTLAGILFFAYQPQKFFPMFTIQGLHCTGTSTTESGYSNKKYFSGRLRLLYDQAMMFLKSSLITIQDKETFNTPGRLEIPEPALEETIINALIHRDYYINASIRVFIFSDRVEIISPGKLPNSLTVEKIKSGISIARNPVFHSLAPFVLDYSGFGTGIDRILSHCPNVELINDVAGEEFRTIFPRPRIKNAL